MKENGTFLVGTDFSFNNWFAYGLDSIGTQKKYDITKNRLRQAYSIGVKMAFGLTAAGFNRKRLADIKDEIETALKLAFGNNIDLEPEIWQQHRVFYGISYPVFEEHQKYHL